MTYSQHPVRHFIVGNGASLKETPLELLEGEISWGMNRVHLLYPETPWRPTFYFMCDFNQQNTPLDYWKECITAHADIPKFLWDGFRSGDRMFPDLGEGIGEVPNTTWIPRCQKHHYYNGDNYKKRAESWHLPDICTAFSGLGAMMQLAVLHGATELYLLGCDLYEDGGDYNGNFFTSEYTQDYRPRAKQDNITMLQMHTVALRSSPIPIYNCTVGGALNIYPRQKLEEIL